MGKINLLSFDIANLIAAGEVVDRPASVVKELMENAVDAGATQITCEIKGGGVSLIRVTDNGCGMTADDLPLCIRRHATSKIHTADDLTAIATLGFRGEALAAIAAVSRLSIITKTPDAQMGTMLVSDGGSVTDLCEVGAADGTTVVVEGLFANVPARRKFLKKDRTEAMAVSSLVEKIALSRPDVSVRFICDGESRFVTAGDGDVRNALYALYGRDFAAKLLPLSGMQGGVGVSGYVGTSENNRGNRSFQNAFINGRYVRSKTVIAAVEEAFTSYMAPERFPVCCVYLTVDRSRVDVNVHPSKMEVRFSDERPVFEAVYWSVRTALEKNESRPEYTLSDRKKDSVYEAKKLLGAFTPIGGGQKAEQMTFDSRQMNSPAQPHLTAHPDISASATMPPYSASFGMGYPAANSTRTGENSGAHMASPTPFDHVPPSVSDPAFCMHVSAPKPTDNAPLYVKKNGQNDINPLEIIEKQADNTHTSPTEARPESQKAPLSPSFAEIPAEVAPGATYTQDAPAAPQDTPTAQGEAAPAPWRLIGVAFDCYLIVDCTDSLLLVDQHAAHERVLFEGLRHQMLQSGRIAAQTLLVPLSFSVSAEAVSAAQANEKELHDLGYSFSVEGYTVSLSEIPSAMEPVDAEAVCCRVTQEMAENAASATLSDLSRRERTLYQMACKAAIKGGRSYDAAHLQWLLDRLREMPEVLVCPHGRPIAYRLTRRELDHRFGRT